MFFCIYIEMDGVWCSFRCKAKPPIFSLRFSLKSTSIPEEMATFLHRILVLYNVVNSLVLYLVPKKLRKFLPTSWFHPQEANLVDSKPPSSLSSSGRCEGSRENMDFSQVRRVFELFDRNGDGRITKKELSDSLENLGIFIAEKDLTQMIEKIDVNGDGFVDIEEFKALYESTMTEEKDEDDEVKEAFNVFDQNGDGFITVDELKSVLGSLGMRHGKTVEDCKKMIMKVDEDGDGKVDLNEFKQMMRRGGFSALR